jgi:hypothetical protein
MNSASQEVIFSVGISCGEFIVIVWAARRIEEYWFHLFIVP